MTKIIKLADTFYKNHVVEVARNLLGKRLVYGPHRGIITEAEAYIGHDDEASHAYRGVVPGSGFIFGSLNMFLWNAHLFKIVTKAKGRGSAVLIRGFIPSLYQFTKKSVV